MMMQLMQVDPRMMDVFKELTGIDLMDLQAEKMKDREQQEDLKKKAAEMAAKREAEEAKRKKEEAEAALPEEEKQKLANKKLAEAKKAEGNEAYKAKNFQKALELYGQAIAIDETELTYYTNRAACFYEMKQYD
jgi:tetratricopeptide (TPR) repeat protein